VPLRLLLTGDRELVNFPDLHLHLATATEWKSAVHFLAFVARALITVHSRSAALGFETPSKQPDVWLDPLREPKTRRRYESAQRAGADGGCSFHLDQLLHVVD
jgi:hypothetical protein